MTESDLLARKKIVHKFFWNRLFWTSDERKNIKNFFSNRRGPIGHFFNNFFSISVAKMGINWLNFDRKSWLIMEFPFTSQGTRDGFSLDTSASKINSDVGRAKFLKTDGGAHRTKIYDQIVGRDSDAKAKKKSFINYFE